MISKTVVTKLVLGLALTGCLVVTQGCAAGARSVQMTASSSIAPISPSDPGYKRFRVASAQGGSKTNPMWMSNVSNEEFMTALESSLRATNYLADQADQAKAEIVASLIALQRPMAGLNLSVTTQVRYSATEAGSEKVIFDDTVAATGTAKFGDSLIAVERLRLANEAAVKANIEAFIERLKEALAAKQTASR
jgi:hypothetical protein